MCCIAQDSFDFIERSNYFFTISRIKPLDAVACKAYHSASVVIAITIVVIITMVVVIVTVAGIAIVAAMVLLVADVVVVVNHHRNSQPHRHHTCLQCIITIIANLNRSCMVILS